MTDLGSLPSIVQKYQQILKNTESYRTSWEENIKETITGVLQSLIDRTGISANIEMRDGLKNLVSIVFSLGVVPSGIYEP